MRTLQKFNFGITCLAPKTSPASIYWHAIVCKTSLIIKGNDHDEYEVVVNSSIIVTVCCTALYIDFFYTPPPNVVGRGYIGFTVSVRLFIHPSVHVVVRVCGWNGFRLFSQLFLHRFARNSYRWYVFWVKEATHDGNFRKFKICHFGRIYTLS